MIKLIYKIFNIKINKDFLHYLIINILRKKKY